MEISIPRFTARIGIWTRSYWPVLATLLLGFASGFRGIDNQDLWYDELETAFAVSTNLEGALDPYTIPYYAILHAFTLNGALVSDFTVRALSVIAMALAAAFVARAARESTASNISSFVAGVVFLLAPGALRLSHEARPYALAALGSSIAFYLLTKALKSSSWRIWLVLTLTVMLTTVVAAIALFLIPTCLMVIAIKNRRQLPRFLLYFSWVIPIAVIGLVISSRYSDLRAWLSAPEISGFRDAPIWISTSDAFGLYGATAFALALLALSVTTKWGSQLLLAIVVGIVAIWVGSQGSMSFWTGRTFIIFLPLLAVAAAAVLANATWVRAFALLVILGVAAQPSHAYLREPGNRGPEWSNVAELVAQQSQQGDKTNDRLLFLALHHYQPGAKVALTESTSGTGIWSSVNSACSGQLEQVITSDATYMICR